MKKTVIIDGDACPNIEEITNLCKKTNTNLIIYSDVNHIIENDYATNYIVDQAFQNVDIHILNNIKKNNILITNDYELASLTIMKEGQVINHKGLILTKKNIDLFLLNRYINKLEKQKIYIPKRTQEDEKNLLKNLEQLIKEE